MYLIAVGLFALGLCAGSFVNALVWRIRQQELAQRRGNRESRVQKKNSILNSQFSILYGRSMCPYCRHELATRDLIPALSWLALHGKCRYCRRPISLQYPAVELAGGLVFAVSYLFWPTDLGRTGELLLFVSWLLAFVGLLALFIYEVRWMTLPNKILYPALLAATAGRLDYILFFSEDKAHSFWLLALSLTAASGIFWLIHFISSGKWIGYGDVRLGLVTGSLLATPAKSLLMILTASVIGTLFALPSLLAGKRAMTAKIPFGPFLIAATFLVLLFGQEIIDWYTEQLS